jgi:hypothetical protein
MYINTMWFALVVKLIYFIPVYTYYTHIHVILIAKKSRFCEIKLISNNSLINKQSKGEGR